MQFLVLRKLPVHGERPVIRTILRLQGGSFGFALLHGLACWCLRQYGRDMFMLVRRVAAALSMTGMVAALFRIRGTGGVPPQTEGWREVSGPDLR